MVTFSIIQKSQLEGAKRLDGEYYQPEYLLLLNKLFKVGTDDLGNKVEKVTQGPNPLFLANGKVCLNGRNINSYRVDPTDSNFVSEQEYKKYKGFRVSIGDILITLKGLGSIGKTGYVFEDLDAIFSRDVGLIRAKENSEFIFAFLMSKYGVFQIERSTSGGTGQLTLTTNYIKHFKIPRFDSQAIIEIKNLVNVSESQHRESLTTYRKAENLLLEELGLKDFKVTDDLSFVINLSDIQQAHRVDAEYFQPKYEKLLQQIRSKNGKKLGDLVTMKKGFEPGSEAYQEEGKLFIRVSSLSINGIEDRDQKYLTNDLYQKLKPDFEPKVGEILLTKDATPGIAYVLKNPVEGIISGGILRLKIKQDIDPEYLALCVNSVIGQMQAERDAGGSIIAHWRSEQIRDIFIPILTQSIQEKIADLVRQSHEVRKKSKELLEEAKRKVEEMIERGGE